MRSDIARDKSRQRGPGRAIEVGAPRIEIKRARAACRARRDDMARLDDVQRLRVGSGRGRLTVSLDGEVLRVEPPLDYRIRKGALRVIAPI